MSGVIQRVKQAFSPEEKLKAKTLAALNVADRIIVEMQAQRVNIKRCAELQESMLNNLHKIMDGALKIGNKPLYIQTGKLAEVVSDWHLITKQMMEDESYMIQFASMTRTFYQAILEYRQIVKDFCKTTQDFVSLKEFGLSIPKQIEITSAKAAQSFRDMVKSLSDIKIKYTRLTDFVLLNEDDEERLSREFDEERQRLVGKKGESSSNKG
jgi:hypothetical protein